MNFLDCLEVLAVVMIIAGNMLVIFNLPRK